MSFSEQVYQRKFAYSADLGTVNDGGGETEISTGGMSNKNTEWMRHPYTWAIYIWFIMAGWFALHMTGLFTLAESTTLTNVLHGLGTFIFFHWIKGSPDEFTQGDWNGLTFWEQLDAGLPWTPTKKFMMLVPAVLCLVPSVLTDYQPKFLLFNLPVFVVLVVAKLPSMHRVRIMSINSTPGIDDRRKAC